MSGPARPPDQSGDPPTVGQADVSSAGVLRTMLGGAFANYLLLGLRLAVGIFLTRTLFLGMAPVDYGFWVLLWSVFGYALLLDFGFGVAMVKYASEATVHGDWDEFSSRFNTIFFTYCGLGGVIAAATLLAQPLVPLLLGDEIASSASVEYRNAFLIFGFGMAVLFPLGVYREVLRGVGRIPERNLIDAAATLANFILITVVVQQGRGLVMMALASVSVSFVAAVATAAVARRLIPDFRFDWKRWDPRFLRSTLSFSVFAYIVTLCNLAILRSDQLLIGGLLAVSVVGPYQVVWRLADMVRQLSVQVLEALGPVSAALAQAGTQDRLNATLLASGRIVAWIATFLFVPLFIFLDPLLEFWLHLDDADARLAGRLLLAAVYVSLLFKSTASQVLLMCREERALASATLVEAILKLALSIGLCVLADLGVVGIALGTLIATAVTAAALYVPMTCRFTASPAGRLLRALLGGVTLPALLAAGAYFAAYHWWPPASVEVLLLECLPGAIVYLVTLYALGLARDERSRLWELVRSARRLTVGSP